MPRRTNPIQRQKLLEELRTACSDQGHLVGQMLPPFRQLAARYKVSQSTIAEIIAELTREGLLYTTPRVGTFVGKPHRETQGVFLIPMPYVARSDLALARMGHGFEHRVAQMGGTIWMPSVLSCLEALEAGTAPAVAGVFFADRFHYLEEVARIEELLRQRNDGPLPFVRFGHAQEDFDALNFDDVQGGVQAAEYLIQAGHRAIAFLGLHATSQTKHFDWSVDREKGWRSALAAAGLPWEGLSFLPAREGGLDSENQSVMEVARQAAGPLVEMCRTGQIRAVVVVNSYATQSLIQALVAARVPMNNWPQLVSFDDATYNGDCVLSSLALPWEEVGTRAAEILGDRLARRRTGPGTLDLVKLRLIPRFAHGTDWIDRRLLKPPGTGGPAGEKAAVSTVRGP